MTAPLTPKQKLVLDFIRDEIARTGLSPKFTAIAAAVGLRAPASVWRHVETLQAKGYITRTPNRRYSIRLTVAAHSCPTCGQALPGAPV